MLVKRIDFFKDIFNAYPHQRKLFEAFFSGEFRFFVENVHRRAGKDACMFTLAWLNAAITPGNYLYLLPKIQQSKSVIWEATDLKGGRWIGGFEYDNNSINWIKEKYKTAEQQINTYILFLELSKYI